MYIPIPIASLASMGAIDPSTVIATSYLAQGSVGGRVTTWRVGIVVGTVSTLAVIFSPNSAGTSAWATALLQNQQSVAGTIGANVLTEFRHEMRASIYANYQLSASTVIKHFWVSEEEIGY